MHIIVYVCTIQGHKKRSSGKFVVQNPALYEKWRGSGLIYKLQISFGWCYARTSKLIKYSDLSCKLQNESLRARGFGLTGSGLGRLHNSALRAL